MKVFRYWRDPLFLGCCSLYALNRWAFKPHLPSPFLRGQFNDLLLIPCALPLMLWLHRRLGLRQHDAFPNGREILLHLVIWSVVCEVLGPRWLPATGDWKDVVAYATGAWLAWGCWHFQERAADSIHGI